MNGPQRLMKAINLPKRSCDDYRFVKDQQRKAQL
jgi:hypothetical protein